MKSDFCEYLEEMQVIASQENIIVEAQHFDVLDYYYKSKIKPAEAFKQYKQFRVRVYAINNELMPSTVMRAIVPTRKEMF